MRDFGIILDSTIDSLIVQNLFKDASNVSLSFLVDDIPIFEADLTKDHVINSKINVLDKTDPKGFIEAINHQKSLGYQTILILTSSKQLTQSYDNATMAKSILKDDDIYIIDTKTFGPGIYRILEFIKSFLDKNFKFIKIIKLLNNVIAQNETWILTNQAPKQYKTPKILKPFIKRYLLSSKNDYLVEQVIFNNKTILNHLYKQVMRYKGLKSSVCIYIFGGANMGLAKDLQQELFTKNKELTISLYGQMSLSTAYQIGIEAYGIYISDHLEEAYETN